MPSMTPIPSSTEMIDLTGLSIASSSAPSRGSTRKVSQDTSVPEQSHPSSTREDEHSKDKAQRAPWYQDPDSNHPFTFAVKSKAPPGRTARPPFTNIVFFPWSHTPLEHLWNGELYITDDPAYATVSDARSRWSQIRNKWHNTAAVCGGKYVRIIDSRGRPIFQVAVANKHVLTYVSWAINPWNLHPVLIYVHSSVMHMFDAEEREFLGYIREHGGNITSLGVHPLHPHLVFTTSRDCTIRIYDIRIRLDVEDKGNKNEETNMQSTDNIFKIQIPEQEGKCLIGKCVVLLTGGRSGGHEAAVLGADFNPTLPLIATCGMDHAVRIWHLGPSLFLKARFLARGPGQEASKEDKPLFSSTMVHDARVMSVYWLSSDVLLSHSAPRVGMPAENSYGTITAWQWLGMGRFFPPDASMHREPPLRGCISDYRESSSFKLLSNCRVPVEGRRIFVNRSRSRPPLILIPMGSKLVVASVCHLPAGGRVEGKVIQEVRGWELSVAIGEDLGDEEIIGCDMSADGECIAAVGAEEGIWIMSMTD